MKNKSSRAKREGKRRTEGSDSGEEEWQPGDGDGSCAEMGVSGDESAGSMADFIVDDDDIIESASSDGE